MGGDPKKEMVFESPPISILYIIFAGSFAWVPALFFLFIYATSEGNAGSGLLLLFLMGVYLLIATIVVLFSERKSRWIFAVLNLLVLALDVFWFMVALPFSGGLYK